MMDKPLVPFRVHLSVTRGDAMVREYVDIAAPCAKEAQAQATALPRFHGAIVLKVKKVRA